MKKITLLGLLLTNISFLAQESIVDSLENHYNNEKFDLIISTYAPKAKTYSAKAVYYIGLAYYMKEDDENCLKLMNLSIEKNSKDADPHYIKGNTYNYSGKFEKATEAFKEAININSESSYFYEGLGDSYFYLKKYDNALEAYKEAASKEEISERSFFMIPQIYALKDDSENALKAFYLAKDKIKKDSEQYAILIYNIGLLEILKFDYNKAEAAYKELLSLNPNDYEAYSKLIQIYYGKEEYEKAKPYRYKLYEAHKKGVLKDHLKDMFCLHQFKWKNKSVRVFERYQEKPEEGRFIFDKHLFYILDENEEIDCRIQTEYSAISLQLEGPKYILGMNKDKAHYTFAQFGFDDNFEYNTLKEAVLKVLEKEVNPSSSSYKK